LAEDRAAFLVNEKRQAVLCLAFPGPRFENLEDRAALTIVDAFTSGIDLPSGWFHNALRGGEESLVYFVHLSLFSGMDPGMVYVYTQTVPELLPRVHSLLLEQIERLRAGAFTDEELEIGRSMALVAEPYRAQAVNDLATQLALGVLYGGGADEPEKFQEALKRVTREDVLRVVERYFGHMLVSGTGPEEVRGIFDGL
jgi:predicted Zn-dependent peptidase